MTGLDMISSCPLHALALRLVDADGCFGYWEHLTVGACSRVSDSSLWNVPMIYYRLGPSGETLVTTTKVVATYHEHATAARSVATTRLLPRWSLDVALLKQPQHLADYDDDDDDADGDLFDHLS